MLVLLSERSRRLPKHPPRLVARPALMGPDGRGGEPDAGAAERWPPPGAGDVLAALLPGVLAPMAREPERKEPRRSGAPRRGDHYAPHRDTALDQDDPDPSVGDGQADIDK